MSEEIDRRLEEQLAYYRSRAPEYDEWHLRRGRFDRGPEANRLWFAEQAKLEAAVEEFAPSGRVLELACGTGLWTRILARHADMLTGVDAAPEALERSRERVKEPGVRFVEADLFTWEPPKPYDVIFFAFWLSHVPPERFELFWERVDRFLAPAGRVFLIDNLPPNGSIVLDEEIGGPDPATVVRRLGDGQEFRVWKVLHEPEELRARLSELGWSFRVGDTGQFFLWAAGTRGE